MKDPENLGMEIFNESADKYLEASKKYKLIPYDGEIVLFYAKERYYFTDANNKIRFKKVHLNNETKNMWQQNATSVAIYDVDGDHSDMFLTSHGNKFARLLQQHLDKGYN